jgi:hypothetical protein
MRLMNYNHFKPSNVNLMTHKPSLVTNQEIPCDRTRE